MSSQEDILEIRWHGRGGQGAKTAALLFAEAQMHSGKYVQAFPEYGPERGGAPVTAFNRVSDKPIRTHSQIENPDFVVVLDLSLLSSIDITEGLHHEDKILFNARKIPQASCYSLKNYQIFLVDASGISQKVLEKNLPNTPMLGALIKALDLDLEKNLEAFKEKMIAKFKDKGIVEKNIQAIREAYNSVVEI